MKNIVIQAGHINIQYNSDLILRSGTGAVGEQEFTLRIANRLSAILRSKGFNVQQTDANANDDPAITGKDWDFFLAIHYEADTHNSGGGFMTAPDPSFDSVNTESKRIVQCLKNEYFKNTGIVEHEEWITTAMTQYYMWNTLSAKTPCGIIECGVGQNAHDKVILADTDRVCNAIARGICDAFNIPFDTPTPTPPTPPTIDYKTLYDKEVITNKDLANQIVILKQQATASNNQINQLQVRVDNGIKALNG